MRWSCLNVPLGLTDPARFKCAGWEEALIGMAAGSFTSFLDSQNIENTNAANERIAFNTNEANKEINKQQIAWAREKYEQEKAENRFLVDQAYQRELENRAYNSPAALKQRYLQAGINPYLAMYGSGASGGSVGSLGSSVGSPPKYDNPSMIPMQSGAPMQAYSGFGRGLSDIAANVIGFLANEREDRRLQHQMAIDTNQMELDFMKYLNDKNLTDTQVSQIKDNMKMMHDSFKLETDKYRLQSDWQTFQKFIQQYQIQQRDREIAINERLASSNIALNGASINQLNQLVSESQQRIFEMAQNGASQRSIEKYVERQQKAAAEIIELDSERKKRQNSGSARQSYTDFTNWLLDPLKGIIGASASYSSGYSVSHKE